MGGPRWEIPQGERRPSDPQPWADRSGRMMRGAGGGRETFTSGSHTHFNLPQTVVGHRNKTSWNRLSLPLRALPDSDARRILMPIRTKPFTEIVLADVQSLIDRQVLEGHTLEYKRTVDLDSKDAKDEILKDVSAFANAYGGTIIYGVVEGEGDERGLPTRLEGLEIAPDTFAAALDNLIQDRLDERLTGVLHKAVPLGDGRHLYVVRVPASPLAPHMISGRTSHPRFYLRANTVNAPMDMRQVKEAVMQRSGAVDRAREVVRMRLDHLRARAVKHRESALGKSYDLHEDQFVLHVVPLHPAPGGWDLGPGVQARLQEVLPFESDGTYRDGRYSHEGFTIELPDIRHVSFLRDGSIEFQAYHLLDRRFESQGGLIRFPAFRVEAAIRQALKDCAALTSDGLLPLPVLVQLSILAIQGSAFQASPRGYRDSMGVLPHPDLLLQPLILSSWDTSADIQVRRMFDEMWQAWGFSQCRNYHADGQPIEYDSNGSQI